MIVEVGKRPLGSSSPDINIVLSNHSYRETMKNPNIAHSN